MAQSASDSSVGLQSEEEWITFLSTTDIPPDDIARYSRLLIKASINGSILDYVDKDSLHELGIKVLGHKLAILKRINASRTPPELNISSKMLKDHSDAPATARISAKLPSLQDEMSHQQFRKFRVDWDVYKKLTGITSESYASHLYSACDDSVQTAIINTHKNFFEYNESKLLDIIEETVTQRSNPTIHRMQFGWITQSEHESIQNYLVRLRSAATECEFTCPSCTHDLCELNVKDQFIRGLYNTALQKEILTKANQLVTLDLLTAHAEAFEAALRDQTVIVGASRDSALTNRDSFHTARIQAEKPDGVNSMNQHEHVDSFRKMNYSRTRTQNRGPSQRSPTERRCPGCGNTGHADQRNTKCPAWGKTCHNCGLQNHFSSVCRKTNANAELNNLFLVASLRSDKNITDEIDVTIAIGHSKSHPQKKVINVFPDSGASICLAGRATLEQMNVNELELIPCSRHVQVVGGGRLNVLGWIPTQFYIGGKSTAQPLYFADGVDRVYLSKQACMAVGILPPCYPKPFNFDSTRRGEGLPGGQSPASQEEQAAEVHGVGEGLPRGQSPVSHQSDLSAPEDLLTREPPLKPSQIPFKPNERNIPLLKDFIVNAFATSAFDRKSPFPAMAQKTAHIHLKENAVPYARHTPIPVPIHWRSTIKQQLDDDVARGIIKPVEVGEPVIWCSPMVIVRKADGSPRRTVDFQQLNRQCYRETHYTESPFSLAMKVPPASFKSKIDVVDSYHTIELDEQSRPLTTFITEWGRYQYCRMPQGFVAAGDAFVRRYAEITKDFKNHVKIVDDSLLYSNSIEQCFWDTWDYLTLCAENGIVVNKGKFEFCQKKIEFAGLLLTENGVSPSLSILSSIKSFESPKDLRSARAWFGLINQVSWAYSLSECMKPFRNLIKPGSKFYWDSTLEELFSKCKEDIIQKVKDGVRCFDVTKRTCLQTDWSKTGLGYLLLQKHCTCKENNNPRCCPEGWKLVFAGSRFTKGAESRYSPTEGECLAVQWSLSHSKMFTLGCSNLFVSVDHKPLLGILNDRDLASIKNPRLQNLKEHTFDWTFDIFYNPGKWHKGPDAMSRNPTESDQAFISEFYLTMFEDFTESNILDDQIFQNLSLCSIFDLSQNALTLDSICHAGRSDQEYIKLIQTIIDGFPTTRSLTEPMLRDFWHIRENLAVEDGIAYFGHRVIVPRTLRKQILEHLHSAHQGVTSMKNRATASVYWPGLSRDISNYRNNCRRCDENGPSLPKEPLIHSKEPEWPFQKICGDYFFLEAHSYLVVVDQYSGWPTVYHFRPGKSNSANLIKVLREMFSAYGVPSEFASDGGPQLTSKQFEDFLNFWGYIIVYLQLITHNQMVEQSLVLKV